MRKGIFEYYQQPVIPRTAFFIGVIYVSSIIILSTVVEPISGKYFRGAWELNLYLLLAVILSLLPIIWSPIKLNYPTEVLYWALYTTTYVPTILIPHFGLATMREPSTIFMYNIFVFFGFSIITLQYIIERREISRLPRLSHREFRLLILAITGTLMSVLIYMVDIHGVFGFGSRHIIRDSYLQQVRSLGPIKQRVVGYSMSWLRFVVLPLLLALSLKDRMKSLGIVVIGGYILTYLQAGFRSSILIPMALVGVYIFVKIFRTQKGVITYSILSASVGLIFGGVVSYYIFNITVILTVLRRLFLTQGLISGFYFDFFLGHQPVLLTDHIFGRLLLDYPYSMGIPRLIGSAYFNEPEMVANSHLWSRGFASFGFFGILLYSALLAGVFLIYDCLTTECDFTLATVVLFGQFVPLANTDLFTVFFNQGLLFLLLLIQFMPKREKISFR